MYSEKEDVKFTTAWIEVKELDLSTTSEIGAADNSRSLKFCLNREIWGIILIK